MAWILCHVLIFLTSCSWWWEWICNGARNSTISSSWVSSTGIWMQISMDWRLIAFLQNSPNLEHLTLSLKLKQVHSSLHMYILLVWKLYVCAMQVKLVCFFSVCSMLKYLEHSWVGLEIDCLHASILRLLRSFARRMIPWSTASGSFCLRVEYPMVRFISSTRISSGRVCANHRIVL